MKRLLVALSFLCALALLCACAPAPSDVPDGLWDGAVYTEDASVGTGSKTFTAEIVAGDRSVTLTVATDASTLSEALSPLGLLQGAAGYYDTVNGMTASWDKDQSYWALYSDGVMTMYGADDAPVNGGERYTFRYTR